MEIIEQTELVELAEEVLEATEIPMPLKHLVQIRQQNLQ